jgi:hypothetical protein
MLPTFIKIVITIDVIVAVALIYYLWRWRENKKPKLKLDMEYWEKKSEGKTYYQCPKCQKLFETPAYIKTFTSNPVKVKTVCPFCFEVLEEKKNA